MIVFYLALILIPPWLPRAPEIASPWHDFVGFSRFVIWCIWWPFVVLSMLGVGRLWCGLFCPEGALAAWASRYGGNRPVPTWMRWGAIPLLAFITITALGQLFEVDEEPVAQLAILGGSTLLAVVVSLVFARRTWVWCRYLCPVSLLFGVFSRLGAIHFRVDHERLELWNRANIEPSKKEPCPVQIHLPVMSTNRYCLMCFRCTGWRDAIHLRLRVPGEELLRIDRAEPLFWEVVFLFGGAIGLPLGVFHAELLECEGLQLVALLLGSTVVGLGLLSLLTWLSARIVQVGASQPCTTRERFTRVGYLYTPFALFSLFLGLSKPTFEYLETLGFARGAADAIRLLLLTLGVLWSLYVGARILGWRSRRRWAALVPHLCAMASILAAWMLVLRR
jgi:hypothetical protein